MTNFKKVFAFILVVCMVLSMGTGAFATTTSTCPQGCTKPTKYTQGNGWHVGTCDHNALVVTEDCVYDDIQKLGRSYCDCGNYIVCEITGHAAMIDAMEWEFDGTKHWKECEKCGYYEEATHDFGTGWAANVATTEKDYPATRKCIDCGYEETCNHAGTSSYKAYESTNGNYATHHVKYCSACQTNFFVGEHDLETDELGNKACTECDYKETNHACTTFKWTPCDEDGKVLASAEGAYGHVEVCTVCDTVRENGEVKVHANLLANESASQIVTWSETNKVHEQFCTWCDGVVATHECEATGAYTKVDAEYCAQGCKWSVGLAEGHANYCGNVIKSKHVAADRSNLSAAQLCVTPVTCKNCGALLEAAPGHVEKVLTAVAPDCTAGNDTGDGLTEGIECIVCGTVIKAQESIDWTKGHNYIKQDDIPGSCNVNGKVWKLCTICGDTDEIEIDCDTDPSCHTAGTLTFIGYKVKANYTCDETNTTKPVELYECSACGKKTIEKEIDKPAHKWEKVAFASETAGKDDPIDCTNGVYTYLACSECGKKEEGSVEVLIPAARHELRNDGKVAETCTTNAGIIWTCTNLYCEYSFIGDEEGNPVADKNTTVHTIPEKSAGVVYTGVKDNETGKMDWPEGYYVYVAPTCEKKGSEAFYCPTCEALITKSGSDWVDAVKVTEIPKADHSNAANFTLTKADHVADKHAVADWVYTAPTCTTRGYWESNCEYCGNNARKVYDEVCEPAHSPVNGKFLGDAVCGEIAYREIVCKFCSEVIGTDTIPALECDWQLYGEPVKAPTCATTGVGYEKCARCGEIRFNNAIPATKEHVYDYIYTPATCDTAAKYGWMCVYCGTDKPGTVSKTDANAPALNHKIGEASAYQTIDSVKFCGDNFYTMIQKCSLCGDMRYMDTALKNEFTEAAISAKAHKYAGTKNAAGEYTVKPIVITKADCLNDGLELTGVCTVCGWEKAPAYAIVEGGHKAPEGTIAHKYCNGTYKIYTCEVCLLDIVEKTDNAKWTADKDLAKLENHFPEAIAWDVMIANGCTTEGLGTPYCTTCGWRAEKAQVMPAAHTWSDKMIVVSEATCADYGYGYYVCTVCGAESELEAIKKVDHEFARIVRESNDCTLPSYVVFECVNCGIMCDDDEIIEDNNVVYYNGNVTFKYYDYETKTYKTEVLTTVVDEAINNGGKHTWGAEEHRDADCLYAAGIRKTCTKCGLEENVTTIGTPNGHDWFTTSAAANCYVAGFEMESCFVCGAVKSYKEIPALNHASLEEDEDDPRAVEATCSTKGIKVMKCECGYEELVPTDYVATNHVWNVIFEMQAADCKTGKAAMAFVECALCDAPQQVRTLPAEHDWNDGEVITTADCGHEGLVKLTCTVCKATKNEIIPRTAHNKVTFAQAADCVNAAMIVTKCGDCDQVFNQIKVGSKALGHKWSDKTFVSADCENAGSWKWECLREGCDVTRTEVVKNANGVVTYPALDHKGKKLIDEIAANCKNAKINVYLCPICNQEVEESVGTPAYGAHSWKVTSENADEITCANPGFADRECTVCGIKQTNRWTTVDCVMSDYIYSSDVIYRFCLVCGDIETIYVAPSFTGFKGCTTIAIEDGVKKLVGSHKGLVIKAGKEGSCTEAGQIEHIECTVCGTVIQQGAVIPAHNTVATEAVAATCDTVGYTAGVYCNDCKEYVSGHEEIPALGHKPVEVPAVDATITTPGYTAGVQCSVCKEWLEGHELVAQKDAVVLRLCTVRSKPADFRDDSESKVVDMLEKGTEVQITGALVNEYYPVAGGYIHMNYLGVAA